MTRVSIRSRLLVSSGAVLLGFLGLSGIALNQAFERSARAAAEARLQSQVYMLLSAAEMDERNQLYLPAQFPEARLSTPESGLYAQVRTDGVAVWQSLSLSGLVLPEPPPTEPGLVSKRWVPSGKGRQLGVASMVVDWETADGESQRFTFQVAESEALLNAEIGAFRRSLWLWLGAAALALVAVQGLILHWSMAPLRRVARELELVEQGRWETLASDHPRELRRLTDNLNQFISQNENRIRRYRNSLGNLAHSLKTPLAVIRGELQSSRTPEQLRDKVLEQVQRMDETVDYQLQRANALGRSPLTTPVPIAPQAKRVVAALEKVHAQRELIFTLTGLEGLAFPGDAGDLTEILGNLADNACKWAVNSVRVTASSQPREGTLSLAVEDDGPGIPSHDAARAVRRGQRLESTGEGHGVGLAVVKELVEEVYGGELLVSAAELGGARVEVRIPLRHRREV